KYLTGNHTKLRNTLYTIDIWSNKQYDIKLANPDPNCLTCQKHDFPALQPSTFKLETVLCGRNTVQIHQKSHLDLNDWAIKLNKIASVKQTPFLIKAQLTEGIQLVLFPDGRVLVQGTEDMVEARIWYDRFIGS